jgi:hypothetical protein
MRPRTITRYGYKNTHSTAGRGEQHEIVVADISRIVKWHNVYGNPSYYIILKDGTFIRLVDDFGGTNDIEHITVDYYDSRAAARRSDWRLG